MLKRKLVRFKRISWKLTLVYAAMFSFVLIMLSAGVIYGIRYYLIEESYGQVQGSTSITQDAIVDEVKDHHALNNPELLSEATANSQIIVKIADSNGQIVNASANVAKNLSITTDTGIIRRFEIDGMDIVVKNTQIMLNGQTVAYLQVIKNMVEEYSFVKVAMITLGIADVIGILFSVLIGILVSQRMLKPLDKIIKTAKEISISDLNRRIEVKDNEDELARLAKTFNEMLERLRISFEKQTRFVSDASHELRTPISVIRGYTDLVDRWGKDDKVVLEESIEAIKNETKDMGLLVDRLLFLARSDSGKLNITKETFDLHDLAEELVLENHIVFPEQGIKSEIPENTLLLADRELIKQALRALIDNSFKYSPDHDEIRIFSTSNQNGLAISVQDKGIGIPPDMIKEIFERFYRVDSARQRKTGGAGLGLAIVEMIVNVHGGKIDVKSDLGKGTLVTMIFPKN